MDLIDKKRKYSSSSSTNSDPYSISSSTNSDPSSVSSSTASDSTHYSPVPSPTESGSIPSSPKQLRRVGNYNILHEFNNADYVFESLVKDGLIFPVLSPVSDSTAEGGQCSYYATTDVIQTRLRILEATLEPNKSSYHNNYFGPTLSTQNLIDTGLDDQTKGLFDHMVNVGITSTDEYDRIPREEGTSGLKDLTGCHKFKIDLWRMICGAGINVTVGDIEAEISKVYDDDDDGFNEFDFHQETSVPKVIRRFGPVKGVFWGTKDHHMLCEQDIYDQTINPEPLYDPKDSSRLGHAIMLVGYGIARHVVTRKEVAYYVFQDNQGQGNKNKGRILADLLSYAAVPELYEQPDLEGFRLLGGNKSMKMTLKQQSN